MKRHIFEFLKRGLMAAWGGPAVLAIIYAALDTAGAADAIAPMEAARGILSVTLVAFIAGGISMIYSVEQLPVASAGLIHGAVLYCAYLIMYLINDWLPGNRQDVAMFSAIFAVSYAIIWLIIWRVSRAKTERLNQKLKER